MRRVVHYGHMKHHVMRGFTLVELLVVIAIIGLLTSSTAFIVTSVRARARDARRSANIDQLSKALDLYNNQTGAYPVSTSPLCVDGTDAVSTALQGANLVGEGLKDPIYTDTTNCYRYVSDATGATYSLRYYFETSSVGAPGFHTVP